MQVIEKPMDLSLIQRKLDANQYHGQIHDFMKDMRLVFNNAIAFNRANDEYSIVVRENARCGTIMVVWGVNRAALLLCELTRKGETVLLLVLLLCHRHMLKYNEWVYLEILIPKGGSDQTDAKARPAFGASHTSSIACCWLC